MRGIPATLLAAIACWASTAHAAEVGVDTYLAWMQNASYSDGFGVNLRLGQRVDLPPAVLTAEVGGTFARLGPLHDEEIDAVFGGLRLGHDGPCAFLHVGYGRYRTTPPEYRGEGDLVIIQAWDESGPLVRGGLAMNLAFEPFAVGADVAYQAILGGRVGATDPSWISAGLHVSAAF
jgi:hypothetical protein